MSLILNINTVTDNAAISIAHNGNTLQLLENDQPKNHGSFLHTGIQQLLNNSHVDIKEIDAIAVVNGPGSYTGIRVGIAAAKGLCFALNKPLISINTLTIMAHAAANNEKNNDYLLCPLLDARRMEVFFAVYDNNLNAIVKPQAVELNEEFLKKYLNDKKVLFFGNGAPKWQKICKSNNAYFKPIAIIPSSMGILSYNLLKINSFDLLNRSSALYLKEFHQDIKKQ